MQIILFNAVIERKESVKMDMPILYLMVGVPASGKSTYAKRLMEVSDNSVYISRDEIRFSLLGAKDGYFAKEDQVFRTYISKINEALALGKDVYADATHIDGSSRVKVLRQVKYPCHKVAIVMLQPLQMCLERNAKRLGRTRVPDKAVVAMHRKLTMPTEREGFERVIKIGSDTI
jgi:predicted kinase